MKATVNSPIGFKEWQVVCDALASGRQSLLLRKGGIHEGREGFSFAHESFFLFPTRFHALSHQVREGTVTTLPEWQVGDDIRVTHHAAALWAITLTDWTQVAALAPYHIYSEATVRDRFDWQGKGMTSGSIHVAMVRVQELATPWTFPYDASFGGCRSWIQLPVPPSAWAESATPVISDEALGELQARVGFS